MRWAFYGYITAALLAITGAAAVIDALMLAAAAQHLPMIEILRRLFQEG